MPGYCPSETLDGVKAMVTTHQAVLFSLGCYDEEEGFQVTPTCPLQTGPVCGGQLGEGHAEAAWQGAFVAPTVCASSWNLDGLTNPLVMSLGRDRSGQHIQWGQKHDLINLLILQIFILLLKAAHMMHASRRGLYLR